MAANGAPAVAITTPSSLVRYAATYDPDAGTFAASVELSAQASDPDGDGVTVSWYSSIEGFLGTGSNITAQLHPFGDASQPIITAIATDDRGATTEDSQQIIVWIVSDQ